MPTSRLKEPTYVLGNEKSPTEPLTLLEERGILSFLKQLAPNNLHTQPHQEAVQEAREVARPELS